MSRVFKIVVILFLLAQPSIAQKTNILHASSKTIRIHDGDNYYATTLGTSGKKNPIDLSTGNKKRNFTFSTDKDSVTFQLKENKEKNILVLFDGGDSAFVNVSQSVNYHWDGWLKTLKKAGIYHAKDQRPLPAWSYQSPEDGPLSELRKRFKLDSVAGNGTEESRIINLLHWVHNTVPHDGQHDNPKTKNSLSLLPLCKNEHRGLNCRGLATILNECYLAMGFSSRLVTCLPKDSSDFECHVINAVYCKDLKKWLWMDPTNDAYVMNDRNELLSIEEVREHLISGKPVHCNNSANWNHRRATTTVEYLYNYMAKNLYRLECAVKSTFDLETKSAGKVIEYIELLPLDYFKQSPDKTETKHESGATIVEYKTNNVAEFWKAP